MRIHKTLAIQLEDGEKYEAPTRSGRSFLVQQVYATYNHDGSINHIQESGPLVLLRGGVSVDDYGCHRFPKLEQLPVAVRQAIE